MLELFGFSICGVGSMSESDSKFHILFKIWCFILGLALLATGIFYIVGGGKLVSLGGSWYFLISGLFITISAISIFRKKALGVWIFAAVFVGTVIWSLIDAGWEFWPLFSRLMFPAGLFAALLFTLPYLQFDATNFKRAWHLQPMP